MQEFKCKKVVVLLKFQTKCTIAVNKDKVQGVEFDLWGEILKDFFWGLIAFIFNA